MSVATEQERIEKLESMVRHLTQHVDEMEKSLGNAEARIAELENQDNHGSFIDVERKIEDVENQVAQLQADFDDSQLGE